MKKRKYIQIFAIIILISLITFISAEKLGIEIKDSYAPGEDYHHLGKTILTEIYENLQEKLGEKFQAEVCIDTKPVFERLLAAFGGLGSKGPNDLLRTPQNNVQCFIGVLFTEKKLPELIYSPLVSPPCSSCGNCLKNCPTKAISYGKPFDARRCRSYLSIEHRGILNSQQRKWLGCWLYGCDYCTFSCPDNSQQNPGIELSLEWLLKSPASQVKRLIKGSAMEYAGVTRLRRNAVAILMENKSSEADSLLKWVEGNNSSPLIQEQIFTNGR